MLIVLRLEGGLGNQLFQFSFARSLQKRYGGKIIFDLHCYKKEVRDKLSIFQIISECENVSFSSSIIVVSIAYLVRCVARLVHFAMRKIIKDKVKRIRTLATFGVFIQDGTQYFEYFSKLSFPIKFVSGNFMSEKYFNDITQDIKNDLSRLTDSGLNEKIRRHLGFEESVCVHIRRGDYASSVWADKLLVCDFEYYENAIKFLKKKLNNPIFYVFSNSSEDLAWISENFKFSAPVRYVDLKNPDYEEIKLMSCCKHFILSNSTFSWWASYLSTNENKIVVAPSRWNSGVWDMSDIYLPEWHIIEV